MTEPHACFQSHWGNEAKLNCIHSRTTCMQSVNARKNGPWSNKMFINPYKFLGQWKNCRSISVNWYPNETQRNWKLLPGNQVFALLEWAVFARLGLAWEWFPGFEVYNK